MFLQKLICFLLLFLLTGSLFVAPIFAHNSFIKTIKITDNGFEPQITELYKNQKVVFENTSSSAHWPVANFESTPKQKADEYMPQSTLPVGSRWLFKLESEGVWHCYDKQNPDFNCTITVKVGKGTSDLDMTDADLSISHHAGFSLRGTVNTIIRLFSNLRVPRTMAAK